MSSMQDRTLTQSDIQQLENLMTTITYLTMTVDANKLALFVEACERQEMMLGLMRPDAYVKLAEQITRGGAVAKLFLKFRNDLQTIQNQNDKNSSEE